MYSEPCAMLTIRVTPKISDSPAERKNSDEAFARPFRPWLSRTSGDSYCSGGRSFFTSASEGCTDAPST
jgi:hypothetical protein